MNSATFIPVSSDLLQAAAVAAQRCSSATARERVLVSQTAALAIRNHLHQSFGVGVRDGRSASVYYLELLDVCDFEVNGWSIEVRTVISVDRPALHVPTMPLMVGVFSDFYLCAQIDKNLSGIEILGFAARSELAKAELSTNGLFAVLPVEDLRPFTQLPAALSSENPDDPGEKRVIEEWQLRADRIICGIGEVLAAEMVFGPDQIRRIAAGVRDDMWRVFGETLPMTGLEPLFARLFRRFGIDPPVPAPPVNEVAFQNRVEDEERLAQTEARAAFFLNDLNVGERVSLYRYLLTDPDAMEEHRRLRRAFDLATDGNHQSSLHRRARARVVREKRAAATQFEPPRRAAGPEDDFNGIKAATHQPPRPGMSVPQAETPTFAPDFSTPCEVVRIVAEVERLRYGYLFNPTFATEISLVDPLPHQRLAVYEHMLNQPRLRFLLADDAGAGKTIMTGLYIREMLARRLIRRVLIVPPAGLLGNWESEMHSLFSLPFRVVTGAEATSGNPFVDSEGEPGQGSSSNLLIVSVDTLAGKKMFSRLQETGVEPYDLVVFDEAHKLSADRDQDFSDHKTDRYLLAEALGGAGSGDERWHLDWSCRHILLLTATPHMGKDYPYYCLWRLLEPEALSTIEAFNAYPADARRRHFIRRSKEEMVRFDGSPIYPPRTSDTLSYDLAQGDVSEQKLYDETTSYIRTYYNRARILNRSAARLAMSVFQRRLASSTYALLRSFERRLENLNQMIEAIQSGRITGDQLEARLRRKLGNVRDVLDQETAEEEGYEDGREEHEVEEDKAMFGVATVVLADLEIERRQVQELLGLARRVDALGQESKFDRLREVLSDPNYRNEKIIIFTEHRDTLEFLVRRLEGIGFTGHVAQIHGGMDYLERGEQVELFRKASSDGGARYLVATDAAGEGINLQFCRLMINYDIPWNPARLEQRMGRIHRYKQQQEVIILNLVAGKTREGSVLQTLLNKLETIRKELRSDKVFDVIGRVFEGVSIKDYMEQVIADDNPGEVERRIEGQIEGRLTKEQVEALQERERRLYGDGGDIRRELPRLKIDLETEHYRKLLPGHMHHLIEQAAPLVNLSIIGDLDGLFSLHVPRPGAPSAMDALGPFLETYQSELRERFTVHRPKTQDDAIFLHPGEVVFDRLCAYISSRFADDALKGCVFVDPAASQPYLLHLALMAVRREADPAIKDLAREQILEYRLIGIKQEQSGAIVECPVEHLMLLKDGQGIPMSSLGLAANARAALESVRAFAFDNIARRMAADKRQAVIETLPEREDFVRRGYDYQDAGLAAARTDLRKRADTGDARAKAELTKIKDRQRRLAARREEALAVLRREPELIVPAEAMFIAHALVVPFDESEDRKQRDARIEAIAVREAIAFEEAAGATVIDVSTPAAAVAVGLIEHPGFDLLSRRPLSEERAIEVKGRAGVGEVELTENEWVRACNLRERYWLYVVYDCASPQPRLHRIQDPFGKLIVRAKGGVVIGEQEIA
ncbi:MAG: DUF1822 family protein, partial [Acidobacteria bacterium]|nr:DUF1822 family protein [Acidobacteriota bacterium]